MTDKDFLDHIIYLKECIRAYENSPTLRQYKDWNSDQGLGAIQILIKLEKWLKNAK